MPHYMPQGGPAPRQAVDPRRLRERMVESLVREGVSDQAVLAAMRAVPRHLFVDEALAGHAYDNSSLPIGYGQTISQPLTVARMTELLRISPGMRVLEVGTGSGYQAAVLAQMGCAVYSTERLPALHARTKAIFQRLGMRRVHLFLRDGTLGVPEAAPYDRVIVTAGGPSVPEPLLHQLDEKGMMVIPLGKQPRLQQLTLLYKSDGIVYIKDCGASGFVNLVGEYGWEN